MEINNESKYKRFACGIPLFTGGVAIQMTGFVQSRGFFDGILLGVASILLVWVGLWFLDVPTVNVVNVNLNKKDE